MRMIANCYHRHVYSFLWLLTGSFCATVCSAQNQINVHGSVTGKKGEPLPHATITVGEKNAAISDSLGRFSITAPQGSLLKISYVGYFTKGVKVTSETTLAINLTENPDYQQMNDVVVVGYGKQKTPTVTGAVGVISGK